MTKLVFSVGSGSRHFIPKTKVCNSIMGLRNDLLISMFHQAKVFRKVTRGQLEAYRSDWIEWLNANPSSAFLSFHDAFWQYVNDCDSGNWLRFSRIDALKASQTMRIERERVRGAQAGESAAGSECGSLGDILKAVGIDQNQVIRNERALIGR